MTINIILIIAAALVGFVIGGSLEMSKRAQLKWDLCICNRQLLIAKYHIKDLERSKDQ